MKNKEFKPEYIGQLSFYVTAVDETLRKEQDNQTIGLLLCKGKEISDFYNKVYINYKNKLLNIDYFKENIDDFRKATLLMDEYLGKFNNFSDENKITSQSKFRSTFIEELSSYLFNNLTLIKDGTFGIYNKNIFAGMKINNHMHIDIIPKDVDFCIGKKVNLVIDENQRLQVIIPIVCVEVKTKRNFCLQCLLKFYLTIIRR